MPAPAARPLLACHDFNDLREPRLGVMLHYDDSSTDASAVAWFTDPARGLVQHPRARRRQLRADRAAGEARLAR